VLAYRRAHPRSAPFLSLTNFSDASQSVDAGIIAQAGLREARLAHASAGPPRTGPAQAGLAHIGGGQIELAPWSFAWLAGS
jgi:hypothetical protein